jgi:hypothetical protein
MKLVALPCLLARAVQAVPVAVAALLLVHAGPPAAAAPWSVEKANAWYAGQPWPVGCNFSPSTAINQLEMWQAESFDAATIDRELGWAEGLGFNAVRVFLHDLVWQQDSAGLLKRMEQFLALAEKHHIRVLFVPLDAVWDPFPKLGKQRAPKPHVHNSGWVQSPHQDLLKNPARHDELKPYIQGVIGHFKSDARVLGWDLYNEPDNPNRTAYGKVELPDKAEAMLPLLRKAFAWAREVNPSQPLTAGAWIGNWGDPAKLTPMEKLMFEESDIISFHCYDPLDGMRLCVEHLKRYQRPILCTEYMARPRGSTFDPILAYLKEQKVGAFNWGFVAGKTQTIYPWDTWEKTYTAEPPVWFHDIFRADGKPFDAKEVDYIRSVTGRK